MTWSQRSTAAGILLFAATLAISAGGWLVSVPVGLFTLGGMLLVAALLLGFQGDEHDAGAADEALVDEEVMP